MGRPRRSWDHRRVAESPESFETSTGAVVEAPAEPVASWRQVLVRLTGRQPLLRGQAAWAMEQIMAGGAAPAQIAAFAVALITLLIGILIGFPPEALAMLCGETGRRYAPQ